MMIYHFLFSQLFSENIGLFHWLEFFKLGLWQKSALDVVLLKREVDINDKILVFALEDNSFSVFWGRVSISAQSNKKSSKLLFYFLLEYSAPVS